MRKKLTETPADGGLELDKIKVSDPHSSKSPRQAPAAPAGGGGQPAAAHEKKPPPGGNTRHLRTLVVVASILAVIVAILAIVRHEELSLNLLTTGSSGVPDNYLQVGPVSTTLANNEIVELTLNIDCKTPALKKRLAARKLKIKNNIITVISAPETSKLLLSRQYEAVRTRLRDSLEKSLNAPIGEVYFDKLLTY